MKNFFLCNFCCVHGQLPRYFSAALLLVLSIGASCGARAQTIAQDVVIDEHVPVGEPLEKAIDYFTSPDVSERHDR